MGPQEVHHRREAAPVALALGDDDRVGLLRLPFAHGVAAAAPKFRIIEDAFDAA
jgi:hypothetical protein